MEQELLKQILTKLESMETKMNSMESDIRKLKDGQERIEEKIETIYDQTANFKEFKTEVNIKLDELYNIENVTKLNYYEIAKLKSVK